MQHHHCPVSERSHRAGEAPCPVAVTPHPRQTLATVICFLSLWISSFWTLHINGIIYYVAFCIWFLHLARWFSRFSTSSLYMADQHRIVRILCILFIHWSLCPWMQFLLLISLRARLISNLLNEMVTPRRKAWSVCPWLWPHDGHAGHMGGLGE